MLDWPLWHSFRPSANPVRERTSSRRPRLPLARRLAPRSQLPAMQDAFPPTITTTTSTPTAATPFAGPGASAPDAFDLMSFSEALAAIPDDAFARTPVRGVPESGVSRLLALDVLETPHHFEIHASVPGIDPAALDIAVLGESVRIAGEGHTAESPAVTEESDYRWLVRERPVGRFDRTVSLPSPVDRGAVDATVRDGVLIVTLPKVQRPAQVRIPIRVGASSRDAEGGDAPVIDLSPRS